MKKQIFLLMALAVTAIFEVSAKSLPKKQMALQLYSIRGEIGDYSQTHERLFKELAAMGYTAVEAASYGDGKLYGVSPEQYRQDCLAAGLEPISSHTTRGLSEQELKNHDFTEALKWWDQCIDTHKRAGCKYIVTPWGPVPGNLKDAQTLCDYHNAIGEKCNAAGIKYGYHTHSHEFQKVEGQVWIEYMMDHVSPSNMFWQMDVYWCMMAQQSPVYYFKKYPGRFKLLHIKDKYELGQSGMVGFDAIFNNAGLCGLENYVVELEGTDGSIDIMEGVRRSINYLRGSSFVAKSYPLKK